MWLNEFLSWLKKVKFVDWTTIGYSYEQWLNCDYEESEAWDFESKVNPIVGVIWYKIEIQRLVTKFVSTILSE